MSDFEEFDEDSMPCPCQKCGEWFDLTDGYGSEKWYPNTIICASCGREEEKEIELDDEIDELKSAIDDARYTLKESQERLDEIYKTYRPEQS